MDIRYYFITKASDEEWSRYMFYFSLQLIMNLISVFFGYFAVFSLFFFPFIYLKFKFWRPLQLIQIFKGMFAKQ